MGVKERKTIFRNELRARREALGPEERKIRSNIICDTVMQCLIEPKDTVMVYSSKPLEVDTSQLIRDLLHSGNRVVVPIIVKENVSLRLSYLWDPGALVPSTFGVPEPIGNEIPANPKDVNKVVLPMLGWDGKGNRLGYGAGYYDGFLSKNHHIEKIGIAFSCQRATDENGNPTDLPVNKRDVKMDFIVTEYGVEFYHIMPRFVMKPRICGPFRG